MNILFLHKLKEKKMFKMEKCCNHCCCCGSDKKEIGRGSLGKYRGKVYYCEPKTPSCYLYDHIEDIGWYGRTIYRTAMKLIKPVSCKERREFLANTRPMLSYDPDPPPYRNSILFPRIPKNRLLRLYITEEEEEEKEPY